MTRPPPPATLCGCPPRRERGPGTVWPGRVDGREWLYAIFTPLLSTWSSAICRKPVPVPGAGLVMVSLHWRGVAVSEGGGGGGVEAGGHDDLKIRHRNEVMAVPVRHRDGGRKAQRRTDREKHRDRRELLPIRPRDRHPFAGM